MLVKDIMTHNVELIRPGDTLEQTARRMEELDVGPLPVREGRRVVGVITDRDITVRATAAGCDPKATLVGDAMSLDVTCCYEDQDVGEAAQLMEEKQVRRLLVISRANELVGIVSLGDLAGAAGPRAAGQVLKGVSEPS